MTQLCRAGRGFPGYSVICPDGTGDAGGWMAPVPASRRNGPLSSFLPRVERGEIPASRPAIPCALSARVLLLAARVLLCLCRLGRPPLLLLPRQVTPCDKQPAGSKHGCGTVSVPAGTTTFPRAPPSAGPTSRGRRSNPGDNQADGSTLVHSERCTLI